MTFSVVVLAAGKGTRMKSSLPKVLHPIGGKPMVQHIVDTVNKLGATNVHLVYGHGREQGQRAWESGPVEPEAGRFAGD